MIVRKYYNFIILHIGVLLYSFVSIFAKKASKYSFLDIQYAKYFGLMLLVLGIYALIWQQTLKIYNVSVAYSTRALALVWTLIWAVIFFKESITINNIIGVIIILFGIVMVIENED